MTTTRYYYALQSKSGKSWWSSKEDKWVRSLDRATLQEGAGYWMPQNGDTIVTLKATMEVVTQ